MNRIGRHLAGVSLGSLILVTVGIAAGLGITLTYVAYIVAFGVPSRPVPFWEGEIGASALGQLSRIGFSAAALIVGSGAAVIAYRNQRIREEAHARAESREYQDRFLSAASQIGDDNASIRIAGVYAMSLLAAQLTDTGFRQQCVDVLCAYLRMPQRTISDPASLSTFMDDPRDWHVRQTIQRSIATYLDKRSLTRWNAVDIDLQGARLRDFSLNNVELRNLTILGATFDGDFYMQQSTVTQQLDARNSHFSQNAFFAETTFVGRARFYGSRFDGPASFVKTSFRSLAWFYDCVFAGSVGFGSAQFGSSVGFERTKFGGKTGFLSASFGGNATFQDAEFFGITRFRKVHFLEQASFVRASFPSKTTFGGTHFAGIRNFNGASRDGISWPGPAEQ